MIQFLSEYICIHTGFLLCVTCVPHVLCVILAEAQYEQAAICLHHQIIFFPPTLLWRGFVWTPKCRDQRLEIRFKGIYFRTEFLWKQWMRRAGQVVWWLHGEPMVQEAERRGAGGFCTWAEGNTSMRRSPVKEKKTEERNLNTVEMRPGLNSTAQAQYTYGQIQENILFWL